MIIPISVFYIALTSVVIWILVWAYIKELDNDNDDDGWDNTQHTEQGLI